MSGNERQAALNQLGMIAFHLPEQRICQIIVNATGKNDPFYVTDAELFKALETYYGALSGQFVKERE